jgi:hypothetical protein
MASDLLSPSSHPHLFGLLLVIIDDLIYVLRVMRGLTFEGMILPIAAGNFFDLFTEARARVSNFPHLTFSLTPFLDLKAFFVYLILNCKVWLFYIYIYITILYFLFSFHLFFNYLNSADLDIPSLTRLKSPTYDAVLTKDVTAEVICCFFCCGGVWHPAG